MVLDSLKQGEMETGARRFMETIAFGPGAWQQLPEPLRQIFIANAPTFLDEANEPEWSSFDVQRLANFKKPALLTQGDQSEPYFPLVVEQIARGLPGAQRRTLTGAGHVPQVSHPEQYAEMIASFIANTRGHRA